MPCLNLPEKDLQSKESILKNETENEKRKKGISRLLTTFAFLLCSSDHIHAEFSSDHIHAELALEVVHQQISGERHPCTCIFKTTCGL